MGASCGGREVQTLANYLGKSCGRSPCATEAATQTCAGCISPPGQTNPISFHFVCANSSTANIVYFQGSTCAGQSVHTAELPIDTHCESSPDGLHSSQSVCMFGDYHPSAAAISVDFFSNAHNLCPISPGQAVTGIVSLGYHQCLSAPGGAKGSYWYSCTAKDVVGESFSSPDCSGSSNAQPVLPLGCYANTSNIEGVPQFTMCPQHAVVAATPAKASVLRKAPVAPAMPLVMARMAALDAALSAATARARAVIAALKA